MGTIKGITNNKLYYCFWSSFFLVRASLCKVTVKLSRPILQMRKLRLREEKQFCPRSHMAEPRLNTQPNLFKACFHVCGRDRQAKRQ